MSGIAESSEDSGRRLLRESAQAFALRELRPGRFRELRGQPVQFDRRLWKSMAELGWTGLMLPEECGGYGLGIADAVVVLEELGRPLLPEPLVAAAIFGGRLIAHGDNPALKAELLPALAAGELIPAVAWQEANTFIAASASRADTDAAGGGILNGEKRFVCPVSGCDGFIVAAQNGRGLGLYWVARDSGGLDIRTEKAADGSDVGHLTLRNVKVAPGNVAAPPGAGEAVLQAALNEALIACSAELLGLIRGALDMTLEYLRTRVQFGKPIGSFQALQHRAVDLLIQQELAAAALAEVVSQFDAADANGRAALASRVKARCSDAALLVTREAIQMHGAIGYTDEYDIGFYLKRALVLSAWLGNGAEHRARYAHYTLQVAA